MRTVERILLALAVLVVGASLTAIAQSFNPIIEENSVDGLLLGAKGSYKFFSWLEPSLGLAYGLTSQKIRYKADIGVWDLKLSALDWPGTPVLGRIGEAGLKVSLKLPWGLPAVSGFFGTVWPHDPNPPDIAYLTWGSEHRVHLPFSIELGLSQQKLLGWWRLGAFPLEFDYTQTSLSLRREHLSVRFSYGTLKNEGRLPDFIFVQGVKGDSKTIQGDQFWSLQFERSFDMMTLSVPFPFLAQPLGLLWHGAVFVQVSSAGTAEQPTNGQVEEMKHIIWENTLSWGLSVLLSLDKVEGVKARMDFAFTRDGQFQFLFGF